MTASKNEIQLRPLGKLMNLIESGGYNLEYQHDDLVFVNHTAFIFRFDATDALLIHLHFNDECEEDMKQKIADKLLKLSKEEEVNLKLSTNFKLQSNNENKEEFQIIF